MNILDTSPPELSHLMECRLDLLRSLAASLETSSLALVQNDAEAIARGAAHQAELCRQWSCLESELRARASERRASALRTSELRTSEQRTSAPRTSESRTSVAVGNDQAVAADHSARLQAEWELLRARIRYLTRVHCSLLRHLERSLAVLSRVVDSCAPTYAPNPILLRRSADFFTEAGAAGAGE